MLVFCEQILIGRFFFWKMVYEITFIIPLKVTVENETNITGQMGFLSFKEDKNNFLYLLEVFIIVQLQSYKSQK